MQKRYTGMILRNGVLHLFQCANDLREKMIEFGDDWSRIAWIEGVEFHDVENKPNAND